MIYLPEDILPHSNISSPPCALHVQPFKRLLSFQDILPCSNFRSCFLNKNFLILYLSPVISCLLCSFVHNYNMSPGVSVRTQISCPHCQIRVLATVNPCFLFNQIWHFLILSGLHHLPSTCQNISALTLEDVPKNLLAFMAVSKRLFKFQCPKFLINLSQVSG